MRSSQVLTSTKIIFSRKKRLVQAKFLRLRFTKETKFDAKNILERKESHEQFLSKAKK